MFLGQYASHLSDYTTWDQLKHAEDWVLFPENIGPNLSIDETALSQGELYTVLTNKAGKGKKGSLVAMIKGTDADKVVQILSRIPVHQRRVVKEVTLDMAGSMIQIVKRSFPKAQLVTDRFHVQKLAHEAVQQLRIQHRWEALDQENWAMELAKASGKTFIPERLGNGDTTKQLLARSRYLLFKKKKDWTPSQHHRAEILFRLYPQIEKAYLLAQKLGYIYQQAKQKGVAYTKLARWYDEVERSGLKTFSTVAKSIQNHYTTILNYFDNRATNASAEAFNAKIKAFRAQFRGVAKVSFFLYRLTKIYA